MSFESLPCLEVNKINKSYPRRASPSLRLMQLIWPSADKNAVEIIRDVSFSLAFGETLAIVGRNGAGKSTLLQIICGTLQPTSGGVQRRGKVAALLELGAGFNPDFTGRENIYLNAAIHGLSRQQTDSRMDSILAFADIGNYIDQPLRTYSSGMQVRLAFSAITHVDADILIIDEALAVGDAFFVQKCMRFLRDFQKKGSILFVSHDSSAVTALCDRALWLESGQIKMLDSAKIVSEAYLAQQFDEDAEGGADSFGLGGALIEEVQLSDLSNAPISITYGNEIVRISVKIIIHRPLISPIVGFYVKDRLGQSLFGSNTTFNESYDTLSLEEGKKATAIFEFLMPKLQTGTYTIAVAVAEGTQSQHVQHHWIHDALVFHAKETSGSTGLVGIPMQKIQLIVN